MAPPTQLGERPNMAGGAHSLLALRSRPTLRVAQQRLRRQHKPRRQRQRWRVRLVLFGLKGNTVMEHNVDGRRAGLGAGSGGTTPPGGQLLATEKVATARRDVGGGEAGAVIDGSPRGSPPASASASVTPEAWRVARQAPIGAEVPEITATPARLLLFPPTHRTLRPEGMEASAAHAIVSPKDEVDGCEPEPLEMPAAGLPLLELVGEASNGPSTEGSLPSMPPPAEEEEDELYRQSLEIISRYIWEQATGAKDAKPMGWSGATSRKALETLRRVGGNVQRKHEMAFQTMLRKLDIKNKDDVKSLSPIMLRVFNDSVTNWCRIVTLISFGAFVAKHLKSINQESCIELLAENITGIILRTKRDWLVKQGGWDGFVEFFYAEDLEGSIRNVLLALLLFAGVGIALVYLRRAL
ncbi:induced myeloid leukemia cell differentiation protein Mcl-1-like [Lemur catta]|uniref:induced myeloid leukemia cell differentiation protein Mcl-1-like n=1 Tax=Lemur catta TaxID=9447 RepID=UPI001E267BD0|nr:induced myeloid leukemia cell differentiation protein Mcl-1-like [Lemur catta]